MAAPTIFSDICDANGSRVGRRTNDGSIFSETAIITFPATTAADVNGGLIFCPAGTKASRFVASIADGDAGTDLLLDFGFMYKDVTGSDNTDAFVDGSTIGQTGGTAFYPAAAASAAARTAEPDGSFIFLYDGWLTVTPKANTVETEMAITVTADLTAGAIR